MKYNVYLRKSVVKIIVIIFKIKNNLTTLSSHDRCLLDVCLSKEKYDVDFMMLESEAMIKSGRLNLQWAIKADDHGVPRCMHARLNFSAMFGDKINK